MLLLYNHYVVDLLSLLSIYTKRDAEK